MGANKALKDYNGPIDLEVLKTLENLIPNDTNYDFVLDRAASNVESRRKQSYGRYPNTKDGYGCKYALFFDFEEKEDEIVMLFPFLSDMRIRHIGLYTKGSIPSDYLNILVTALINALKAELNT